jgi:hypothetical protein
MAVSLKPLPKTPYRKKPLTILAAVLALVVTEILAAPVFGATTLRFSLAHAPEADRRFVMVP